MILEMLCFKGTVQLNLEVFMTLMNTKAYSKNSPCLQNVEFQPGNGQKSKQLKSSFTTKLYIAIKLSCPLLGNRVSPFKKQGTTFRKPCTHFGIPAMTELTNVSQFWAGIQKSKNMMIPMICPSFDNITVTLSLRKTCKALAYNERLFLLKMCIVQFIIQQYTAVVYHFNFDQAGNFTHQQKRLAKLT